MSRNGDFSNIVRGSKGYLKCGFNFVGDEWSKRKIVAVFSTKEIQEYAVIVLQNTCKVPDEITDSDYFKMELIGAKGTNRIKTNKILISQEG